VHNCMDIPSQFTNRTAVNLAANSLRGEAVVGTLPVARYDSIVFGFSINLSNISRYSDQQRSHHTECKKPIL
jgi:hypothetical protein